MPSHKEIREFSDELVKETGYDVIDEPMESRVVLLSSLKRAVRFGDG
jgi:wyosine [tRNA(Phe)-imidazoG37] synthetase (radical SAM superfamily)